MAFVIVCPAGYGRFLICVLAPSFQNESMRLPGLSSVLTQINRSKDFRNDMKACQPLEMSALHFFACFTGALNALHLESIQLSAGFV